MDFFEYSRLNLVWFTFNFVKVVTCAYVLWRIDGKQRVDIQSRAGSDRSYVWLMYGCFAINVFQFLVTRRIFLVETHKEKLERDQDEMMFDKSVAERENKLFEDDTLFNNYADLERRFVKMPIWIQVVKIVVFVALVVAYFAYPGKELVYAMYLPLDFTLELFMTVYRVTAQHLQDITERDEQAKRRAVAELNREARKDKKRRSLLIKSSTLALEAQNDEIEDKYNEKIAKKMFDRMEIFKPGNDAYAMAYKSFHDESRDKLDLSPREVFEATQGIFFVSGIQLALIYVVFMKMQTGGKFEIVMPSEFDILATRFVCSALMHLQVMSDITQGL